MHTRPDIVELAAKSAEAAQMLKLVANERRLQILCRLHTHGEMSVGDLADTVGLGQSALSQHLARMREEGLVATRRAAQTVHYRIGHPDVARLLELLGSMYCK